MIRKTLLILLAIALSVCKAQAQQVCLSCNILDAIVKDKDFFQGGIENGDNVAYETDTLGRITAIITKGNKNLNEKSRVEEIILIDTLGFFLPQCSKVYKNRKFVVYNIPPALEKDRSKENVLWVSGIATGKNNALAIGFLQKSSNHFIVYYLSIAGRVINVFKKSGGDF